MESEREREEAAAAVVFSLPQMYGAIINVSPSLSTDPSLVQLRASSHRHTDTHTHHTHTTNAAAHHKIDLSI